jgi:hypothetical protein
LNNAIFHSPLFFAVPNVLDRRLLKRNPSEVFKQWMAEIADQLADVACAA